MKQLCRYLLAAGLGLNGLFMLVAPETWFALVPGVSETGPFNPHLVRDVGSAYFIAACALLWLAFVGRSGRLIVIAAAGFLLLHAGLHVWEVAAGISGWNRFVQDIPGVILPALLALWLVSEDKPEARYA